MATPYPEINPFNPLVQELRDSFERECLPDGGFEALDLEIRRAYVKHARCGLVRARMADALSGRWGFDWTQHELGKDLGMDRSRISDAATKGEISLDNFFMLTFHPGRPLDLQQRRFEFDEANRSGFIAACQFLMQWEHCQKEEQIQRLIELDYELLCELMVKYPEWVRARLAEDHSVAFELAKQVIEDKSRDAIPFWYTRDDRVRIKQLADALTGDACCAHTHFGQLHHKWIRVFVSAHAVCETLRWEEQI